VPNGLRLGCRMASRLRFAGIKNTGAAPIVGPTVVERVAGTATETMAVSNEPKSIVEAGMTNSSHMLA
jgi:hypothetical protein